MIAYFIEVKNKNGNIVHMGMHNAKTKEKALRNIELIKEEGFIVEIIFFGTDKEFINYCNKEFNN